MCGRFTLHTPTQNLVKLFELVRAASDRPRYNIAPTQAIAVVRKIPDAEGRELVMLRWGLIPAWSKDAQIGARMINARAETAAEKPAFRAAFKARRCLVPADGFYEWQRAGRQKQPFYFRLRDGTPFALAGLWEEWEAPGSEIIESASVLTTEANELVRPIHDRMPVILQREDYERWLDPETRAAETLRGLLRPYPAGEMSASAVSRRVNNARNDDAGCIEPLAAAGPTS